MLVDRVEDHPIAAARPIERTGMKMTSTRGFMVWSDL
jgi:hypothetical protein